MGYQNSVRLAQPTFTVDLGKTLQRNVALGFPGGTRLWLAAGKIAVALLGIVICFNLWLGFAASGISETIQEIEVVRHQLKDEQIALLAERANLMSEKQVRIRAGEQLALFVPDEEQVFRLR